MVGFRPGMPAPVTVSTSSAARAVVMASREAISRWRCWPDVVVRHRRAVPLGERALADFDEFEGGSALLVQVGKVTGVGGEVSTGEAGVAFVAGGDRREEAHAVGQDPVGPSGQGGDFVEVDGVHGQ